MINAPSVTVPLRLIGLSTTAVKAYGEVVVQDHFMVGLVEDAELVASNMCANPPSPFGSVTLERPVVPEPAVTLLTDRAVARFDTTTCVAFAVTASDADVAETVLLSASPPDASDSVEK